MAGDVACVDAAAEAGADATGLADVGVEAEPDGGNNKDHENQRAAQWRAGAWQVGGIDVRGKKHCEVHTSQYPHPEIAFKLGNYRKKRDVVIWRESG